MTDFAERTLGLEHHQGNREQVRILQEHLRRLHDEHCTENAEHDAPDNLPAAQVR
ncbi:hypothetical protein [Deinococcus peraridilitoris]|uniref:Uncharacterized protein n=1 Tax=Deinococcus peraridilitoris (strain DSM 19664 / LMG 22246 / CIP 109416 / KR-200) TaxID=937777 RepID=L0A4N8_DEIPD|nr:hypothetical protein [Deinococcus peraridilitoris]AFZ68117.1 hypothetical protein Deipe_2652 [Deinococcus peraridilitoris DSM 19664]